MDWSGSEQKPRAWKDIWSAGQSVGSVTRVESTEQIVERLRSEYARALEIPAFRT
jgi:nitronate monooxygenase